MQWMMLPTLAWLDWVIIAGAILLTVGGWIFNAIQKLNEKANQVRANRERAIRQQQQDMHIGQVYESDELQEMTPTRSNETMSTQQRLDALAARRRQQMSQMRAQAGGNEALASQPDNLTAAQKAARDRAREAYKRRAELLARQRQAQQQAAQAKQQAAQSKQQAKAARSAASRSSSAGSSSSSASSSRAAAQAQAARQAQLAQQRARQQAQQQAAQVAAAREARQRAASQNQPPSLDTAAEAIQVERLSGRQTITDEGLDVIKTGGAASRQVDSGALKNALTGRSIRAAFVLKEVLDKPVGLRNEEDKAGAVSYS